MERILDTRGDFLQESREKKQQEERQKREQTARNLREGGIEGFGSAELDKIYKKAKESLMADQINPRNFDLYQPSIIEGDEQKVASYQQKFREQNDRQTGELLKYAKILEAIINERIQLGDWLGGNVNTKKTAEYDDIFNGIDIIAEFNNETPRSPTLLGLGVDISFSTNVGKKLKRIKKEIASGTLGKIKYFESERSGFQGRQTNVPRVVIGVDQKRLIDLIALWYQGGKNKELDSHFSQIIFIEEIIVQLKTYRDYAQKIGQPQAVDRYEEIIMLIETIKKERQPLYQEIRQQNPGTIEEDDRFFRDLTGALDDFEDINIDN